MIDEAIRQYIKNNLRLDKYEYCDCGNKYIDIVLTFGGDAVSSISIDANSINSNNNTYRSNQA